jgi:DNA-directed RNA polymerase specialized sigma24 family protein
MEFLDLEDRQVLLLRQWDGLSFTEIGEHLGISADAARMRYNRGVGRLGEIVGALRSGSFDEIADEITA